VVTKFKMFDGGPAARRGWTRRTSTTKHIYLLRLTQFCRPLQRVAFVYRPHNLPHPIL